MNNRLEDKKGDREKSILLKLSAVLRDSPFPPICILLFLELMKQRVEIQEQGNKHVVRKTTRTGHREEQRKEERHKGELGESMKILKIISFPLELIA